MVERGMADRGVARGPGGPPHHRPVAVSTGYAQTCSTGVWTSEFLALLCRAPRYHCNGLIVKRTVYAIGPDGKIREIKRRSILDGDYQVLRAADPIQRVS
jgi:hypothetical protein